MLRVRFATISLLSLVLGGCGGGGGATNPPPPSSGQQSQSIAFAQPGPLNVALSDATFQDVASGGAGSGAITYQSSNPQVATVDATTGTVTLVAVGTVQITATKAADAAYLSATASYTLTVSASSGVSFTASIGSQDARVSFLPGATGLSFLRSTQADCNTAQFSSCANSQLDTVGSVAITDTAATLTSSASYWLGRGSQFSASPTRISVQKFLARSATQMTSFNGKLWMVGGQQTDIAFKNDVWVSSDGITWTQVTPSASFDVRCQSQLVAFNNRLWLIGGNGAGGTVNDVFRNDVWSTADGVTWREDTASAAFPGRLGHSAFAFKGKMWVIGGTTGNGAGGGNDIWSSVDGVSWTQVTAAAAFAYGGGSSVTEFNNSLWLIGARSGSQTEVWNSVDGINWTQVTTIGGPPRQEHAAGVVNNQLVIAGGRNTASNAYLNDVWTSPDGSHWTQVSGPSPFTPRRQMGYATLNGKLFVVGGEYAPASSTPPPGPQLVLSFAGDVWATSDAATWTQMTPYAPFFAGSYNVQSLNGKLWIVGGNDGVKSRNEVWSSSDGAQWAQAATTGVFDARSGGGTVTFNNRLWVIGGVTDGGTELTDVWSSADGTTWTQATNSAAFGQRHAQAVVNGGSQLYVLGGNHNGTFLNDVWTSSDAVSWSQVAVSTAFPARANAVAASYNGRLWVLGGSDSTGQLADVWSSADGGITWQLASSSVPALANKGVSLAVQGGKLWLTGGDQPGYINSVPSEIHSNTVWSSSDGAAWTQVVAAAPYSGRSNAALVEFNNQLWVIGGRDAYSPRNDAWFSPDGVSWRVMYSGMIALP